MARFPDLRQIYKKNSFDVTYCGEAILKLYFVTCTVYNLHMFEFDKRPCDRQQAIHTITSIMQYIAPPMHSKLAFGSTCYVISKSGSSWS